MLYQLKGRFIQKAYLAFTMILTVNCRYSPKQNNFLLFCFKSEVRTEYIRKA